MGNLWLSSFNEAGKDYTALVEWPIDLWFDKVWSSTSEWENIGRWMSDRSEKRALTKMLWSVSIKTRTFASVNTCNGL